MQRTLMRLRLFQQWLAIGLLRIQRCRLLIWKTEKVFIT
nr:MAG TPA: hypothetical protein [Caudoviricetes sp.]